MKLVELSLGFSPDVGFYVRSFQRDTVAWTGRSHSKFCMFLLYMLWFSSTLSPTSGIQRVQPPILNTKLTWSHTAAHHPPLLPCF